MKTIVIAGAGDRADVYADYALTNPDEMKIVGIADAVINGTMERLHVETSIPVLRQKKQENQVQW